MTLVVRVWSRSSAATGCTKHPAELPHLRQAKYADQFRLPEQYDLQQLGVLTFQVAQHAQVFERIEAQVLGLVEDGDGCLALAESFAQMGMKPFDQFAGRLSGPMSNVELAAQRGTRS
jgi:hypothetical protein